LSGVKSVRNVPSGKNVSVRTILEWLDSLHFSALNAGGSNSLCSGINVILEVRERPNEQRGCPGGDLIAQFLNN
jgi:hypothetical protein